VPPLRQHALPLRRVAPDRQQLKLRLRDRLWPVLQTAMAAVISWYLARLVVDDPQPAFASIAAVICVGAVYGEQPLRGLELTAGVVIGLSVADLLVHALGTGPAQVGATVLAAMLVAVLVGGGPLLVSEAGVSAILLTATASNAPLFPARPLEAVIGAGVAMAITSLAFPPDPQLRTARAVNAVLAGLGSTLEDIAASLENRDPERAAAALRAARSLDDQLGALSQELAVARETVRLSPVRRGMRSDLHRYVDAAPHITFAVLDARALARNASRALSRGGEPPEELVRAVRELRQAVWDLGGALDRPGDDAALREHTARAIEEAERGYEKWPALDAAIVAGPVRSIAVDLFRAAHAASDEAPELAGAEDVLGLVRGASAHS
jgi:uncharacterized membrane protein YgaE (UPF0421/DUF939 family)